MNHWVSTDPTPRPSDATKVNAREPLLRRMRECERVRDHLPNLVAVNFYRRGDVFGVVDELNGVRWLPTAGAGAGSAAVGHAAASACASRSCR